jgi:hypothetical protein
MSSRNVFASILMACLLAFGFGGLTPAANAASAGQPLLRAGEAASSSVVEAGYRHRRRYRYRRYHGPVVRLPIVPYVAYDYPYYYSRGHYPTHIGRGYVYYGYPYKSYKRVYAPRYYGRCAHGHRRCASHRHSGYRY